MARPTKINEGDVLVFVEEYFQEYKEEFTTYSLSQFISEKYAKCSWQKINNVLTELYQAGLVKRRITKDKTLWLPLGEQITF